MLRYIVALCFGIVGLVLLAGPMQALEPEKRRLFRGVVRLEVPGREETGTGIIVRVEGTRAFIITALHVIVGPPEVRNTSGWKRYPERIPINVQFFGDPVPVRGRLRGFWRARLDPGAVVVADERLGERDVGVAFGLGSAATLAPPYPAVVVGHGGARDWDWVTTRVRVVAGAAVNVDASRITNGHSGAPLIDSTRHVLIGMITAVSRETAEAVPADLIAAQLESWAVEHHLRRTRISTPMVRVPAGPFLMGGGDAGRLGELPREVYLDAYFIDKYEVTVADFRRFVEGTRHPYRAGGGNCNYEHPEREAFPMNCVTWEDASAFAKWGGKALPTEAQWEKAARGTGGLKYPWGSVPPRRGDAALRIDWPVAVGGHPADRSPYGATDMLGNVSEWVADWYQRNHLRFITMKNPQGPPAGDDRVLRGGSFKSLLESVDLTVRKRDLPDSGRMNFDYGFRCVLDEARTE